MPIFSVAPNKSVNKKGDESPSSLDEEPIGLTKDSPSSKRDSQIATSVMVPETSEEKQLESKDSFFTFLQKILGQDVDSLRISIPMFLLEPVSNLQYLADLDYVEELVNTGNFQDPLDRFLSVLKFIVSSWKKALKKSKKPLNPVLGESIQAHFLAKENSNAPPVYLIGEQISHHPPISAFYVTCPDKNIDLVTIFDVKAKFDGTSLALSNNSVADIYVKDYDEIYNVELPDAIIVGVLTMQISLLWRGTCTLTCKKTGLRAKINFKDQAWFGKAVHELNGEIFKGSDRLATLSGSWNNEIYVKKTGSAKPELFFTCKKNQEYQTKLTEDSSSLHVWRKVIETMKCNDLSTAKKLKTEIENNQRMIEKERKSGKRAPYTPVYFSLISSDQLGSQESVISGQDKWIYTGPRLPFKFPEQVQ